ncbi:M20 family metallo-hydrolase [Filibacter tadaridae]|uniref:N-carbamoyl-L-amino acid hydrolase n=1 Tax=Filibacter tadaridae TaxID=2483811 RepID=A0A3P5WU57_9BACL|nr:M20 family metallo-hydrolase [Filibacter tadaridae]VDC25108.1 N-carbamoyl-L-amino acid hydrolase [Filibacter tadaridae]
MVLFNDAMEQRLLGEYDLHLDHSGVQGKRLASRLREIAQVGFTAEMGSCRLGYSDEEKQAKDLVKQWMRDSGLEVRQDDAGNVIGRLAGKQDNLPAILSGSHVDSVPNGGHFDGVLGVLTALEVVEAWKETNYQPSRPVEVVIFSDEEGSRFNAGLTGSKAMMGDVGLSDLKSLIDHEGVPFEEVVRKNGLSANSFMDAARDTKEIAAFVEVHIEQGKQLEKNNEPVGIVTGITGLNGLEFSFKGKAGHAGNTPMDDRQDAMVAASEFILNVSFLPKKVSSTAVATVGRLHVFPNGTNVIPGEVKLSVDIRDIHRETLDELVKLIIDEAKRISTVHKVDAVWEETSLADPVLVQDFMQVLQADSLKENQIHPIYIPSGAGHDAMIVGRHVPIAMFFIRSKDGISHNPVEWTSLNDCVTGVHVLKKFLEKLQHSI